MVKIFLHNRNLLDGKSSLALPKTTAWDTSPGSRSARSNGVAERKTQTQVSLFIYSLSHSLRVEKGANLILDKIWFVFKGENKCVVGFLLTLLRSLAVTLSSSRHGIRWTKANIWYLAFMNSVLLGLNRHKNDRKSERSALLNLPNSAVEFDVLI